MNEKLNASRANLKSGAALTREERSQRIFGVGLFRRELYSWISSYVFLKSKFSKEIFKRSLVSKRKSHNSIWKCRRRSNGISIIAFFLKLSQQALPSHQAPFILSFIFFSNVFDESEVVNFPFSQRKAKAAKRNKRLQNNISICSNTVEIKRKITATSIIIAE